MQRAHDRLVGKHVSAPVLEPRRRTAAASAAAVAAVATAAAVPLRLVAAVVLPSASIRAALRLPDPPSPLPWKALYLLLDAAVPALPVPAAAKPSGR